MRDSLHGNALFYLATIVESAQSAITSLLSSRIATGRDRSDVGHPGEEALVSAI